MSESPYQALLVVSFGGPEQPDDVLPFLENVLRGKNVPRERLLQVAEHYYHFGGKSPINDQNRALIDALRAELANHAVSLPVYWGNRNWHPMLADTLRQMRADGIAKALAFMTSAFSSYSGCRQYREDIARAQAEIGDGLPEVHKIRVFYNHPGFLDPMAENVRTALARLPGAELVFTAHSIPLSMADTSPYVGQLQEAIRLICALLDRPLAPLVYQSRSGPPAQPWLEPDISDHIRTIHASGVRDLVIVPLGFVSDHMEVLFDLDTEALDLCRELGMNMVRASTVGVHPRFVSMIRELIEERTSGTPHIAIGANPPYPDVCPLNCCPAPQRPRP